MLSSLSDMLIQQIWSNSFDKEPFKNNVTKKWDIFELPPSLSLLVIPLPPPFHLSLFTTNISNPFTHLVTHQNMKSISRKTIRESVFLVQYRVCLLHNTPYPTSTSKQLDEKA